MVSGLVLILLIIASWMYYTQCDKDYTLCPDSACTDTARNFAFWTFVVACVILGLTIIFTLIRGKRPTTSILKRA